MASDKKNQKSGIGTGKKSGDSVISFDGLDNSHSRIPQSNEPQYITTYDYDSHDDRVSLANDETESPSFITDIDYSESADRTESLPGAKDTDFITHFDIGDDAEDEARYASVSSEPTTSFIAGLDESDDEPERIPQAPFSDAVYLNLNDVEYSKESHDERLALSDDILPDFSDDKDVVFIEHDFDSSENDAERWVPESVSDNSDYIVSDIEPDEPEIVSEEPEYDDSGSYESPLFDAEMPTLQTSEILDESLSSFTPLSTKKKAERDKSRFVKGLLLRSAALAVFFAIFCYCGYLIAIRVIGSAFEEAAYDDVRVNSGSESAVKIASKLAQPSSMLTLFETLNANNVYDDYIINDSEQKNEYASYYSNFMKLRARYPDVFGWILLSETAIDYPLMKGDSIGYYLTHNYRGEIVRAGSIAATSNARDDFLSNLNLVTYGHCMTNGSMYRGIKLWYDSAARREQAKTMKIYLYREEGLYIYELFSAYRAVETTYAQELFYSEEEFVEWMHGRLALTKIDNKPVYDSSSRIITMVTCTNVYANPDERYVVHGILKEFMPAEALN